MDLNEVTGEILYRHPWELSRTSCVLDSFSKYLERIHQDGKRKQYVNAGAGDLYFDGALMKRYPMDHVHAVDIGYQEMTSEDDRIHKYHSVEEIAEQSIDYAIMMDSLEYMIDDAGYVQSISDKIEKDGYFFFTLPAFPILFSDHDKMVKNLRRYSSKSFHEVIDKVPGLEIVEEYNFYTSLFLIRFIQKFLHLPIDPQHHVTAHWEHKEDGILTRCVTGCLNLDFGVNKLLAKIGIRLPGLSMLVVCRKA